METIDDIKRELRNISERANGAIMWKEDCITTYPTIAGKQLWSYFDSIADRIEKAVTNCNQLKLREALQRMVDWFNSGGFEDGVIEEMDSMIEYAEAVLAEARGETK